MAMALALSTPTPTPRSGLAGGRRVAVGGQRATRTQLATLAMRHNADSSSSFGQKAASAAVALLAGSFLAGEPAIADLNKYEYNAGGEFGNGTAMQYGGADESNGDFKNQDLRRSNFTAADVRRANFQNAKLNGCFFMKAVAFQTDFTGADLSDTLMDRAVLNEANLTNTILQRVVLTRSDLKGAIIDGADFSNSLIDKDQQQALCRYASGTNPVTGVETRQSLGCSSRRRRLEQTPSSVDGPQVKDEDKEAYKASLPVYQ